MEARAAGVAKLGEKNGDAMVAILVMKSDPSKYTE